MHKAYIYRLDPEIAEKVGFTMAPYIYSKVEAIIRKSELPRIAAERGLVGVEPVEVCFTWIKWCDVIMRVRFPGDPPLPKDAEYPEGQGWLYHLRVLDCSEVYRDAE